MYEQDAEPYQKKMEQRESSILARKKGQTYYAFFRACLTKSSKVMVFPDFFRTVSTLFSAATLGKPEPAHKTAKVPSAAGASPLKYLSVPSSTGFLAEATSN